MTEERYAKIEHWFRARPRALAALQGAEKGLTALVYAAYALLCLWLLVSRSGKFARVLLVPFAVFATGSALRGWINAPRPYEVMHIRPLVYKDTKGKSFPSRHVFCAAVIAAAFGYVSPALGVVMALVTLGIAATRVLGGVHWPKDVAAGILYGGLLGLIGFSLL